MNNKTSRGISFISEFQNIKPWYLRSFSSPCPTRMVSALMNPIRSFCTSFRFFVGPFSEDKRHWGFSFQGFNLICFEILKGLNLGKLVWLRSPQQKLESGRPSSKAHVVLHPNPSCFVQHTLFCHFQGTGTGDITGVELGCCLTVPFLEPFPNICVCSIQRKTRRHDQTGDTRESIKEILELGLRILWQLCLCLHGNAAKCNCG